MAGIIGEIEDSNVGIVWLDGDLGAIVANSHKINGVTKYHGLSELILLDNQICGGCVSKKKASPPVGVLR
jgi:hypothetical protein